MSEERKEGVRQVWVSPARHVWTEEPTKRERRVGPFRTGYLHDPPEGAPEPGERRLTIEGHTLVARHVYQDYTGQWWVAFHPEGRDIPCVHLLSTWLSLPFAPPKPKYRLAAVEVTEEQVAEVEEFVKERLGVNLLGLERSVASLLRIEEIPE